MVALPDRPWISLAEYLQWEAQQDLKYEYVDGEVYAMTGGSVGHSLIAVNIATALRGHLRGGPCLVLGSDAKVQISQKGPFFYPDISVTCDERDRRATQAIRFPKLVVEVLSPTTEAYDRGKKFAAYRRSQSLETYVLVSSTRKSVEVFQRSDRGTWVFAACEAGDRVSLAGIGFDCAIDLFYEDVALQTEKAIAEETAPQTSR